MEIHLARSILAYPIGYIKELLYKIQYIEGGSEYVSFV